MGSDLFVQSINVFCALAKYPLFAETLTREGVISLVMSVLKKASFTDQVVNKIVDMIWSILDVFPKAALYIGEASTASSLFKFLQEITLKGYRTKDKELRNEILILFSLFAREYDNQLILKEIGFMEYIAALSIGLELYPESVKVDYALSTSEQDFEMTKLCWTILYYLTFTDECLDILTQLGFLSLLLETININGSMLSKWNETQKKELRVLSLKILLLLSVRVQQDFSKEQGARLCIEFLQSTGDEALLSSSFSLAMSISTCEQGCRDLFDAEALPFMLETSLDQTVSLGSRTDCIRVVSNICQHVEMAKNEFRLNGGITMLLVLLEQCVKDGKDEQKDEFTFNTVDCSWSAIAGSSENEKIFIEGDGIHYLLSVLTFASDWIKLSVLGCVADLMKFNQEAMEEVLTWKSKDKKDITSFLINMWREAENSPVFAEYMTLENVTIDPHDFDLHVKIYHVLSQMEERIDKNSLSDMDKMELVKIFQFDNLLHDKAWEEISMELEQEGIRPTTPDRERLHNKLHEKDDRSRKISHGKTEIAKEMAGKVNQEEEVFYRTIIEQAQKQPMLNVKESAVQKRTKSRKPVILAPSYE